MKNILYFFHHIHHKKGVHEVHHCGGAHSKINPKLKYVIEHCVCGKHSINRKIAIGHDQEEKEVRFVFSEKCPKGGWHIESGKKERCSNYSR